MSLLAVTVHDIGLRDAHASFDLGGLNELDVLVTYQTDRYRRVVVRAKTARARVPLLAPTYIDLRNGEALTPEEVARQSPRRMHAHTLHGRDVRAMLDTGVYTYEHGAARS